jgi:hypothetical protein
MVPVMSWRVLFAIAVAAAVVPAKARTHTHDRF